MKMADCDHLAPKNPPAPTATPPRVLPEPSPDGDSEGNCPLWNGHIIDATFPLV
jgi:hypothetical protein